MILLCLVSASSFLVTHEQSLILEPGRTEYYLSEALIVEGSVAFEPPISSQYGIVSNNLIITSPPPESVTVSIKFLTIRSDSVKPYSLYEPTEESRFEKMDSAKNVISVVTAERLDVHGSKTVSLSLSDNGSNNLSQGLSVTMAGNLAGVDIKGHIADEEGAFVPQGTTEKIEDFDRISISLGQENWRVGLGDIDFSNSFIGYGSIDRRIKGAVSELSMGRTKTVAAFGIEGTRRGHAVLELSDAKQGPYYVGSRQSAEPLVPGSERVWLDGRLLARGSEKDYVIDYSQGEITFNSRTAISSQSRSEVDYTYAGSDYVANNEFLGFAAGPLEVFFYRQADSRTHLYRTWSQSEQAVLDTATSSQVVLPGGTYVGMGSGDYLLSDDHYVWAGQGEGDYDVSFRLVDSTSGDYVLNADSGFFVYTGSGAGNYRAEILTSLPERQEALGLSFKKQFDHFGLDFSTAGSRFTPNLYNDSVFVFGHAHRAGIYAEWKKLGVHLYHSLATPGASLPARTSDASASDRWNRDSLPTSFNEQIVDLEIRPLDSLNLGIGAGHLWTTRHEIRAFISSGAPFFDLRGDWLAVRQRASVNLHPKIGIWTPLGAISWTRYDTLQPGQNLEPMLGLIVNPRSDLEIKATATRRIDLKRIQATGAWQDTLYYDRLQLSSDYDAEKLQLRLTTGLESFSLKQQPDDSSWQFLYGELGIDYTPASRIHLSADLSQHTVSVQKEVLYYLPVTPGTGNYRRDPETGEYVPDEKGDYVLDAKKEDGTVLAPARKISLGADLNLAPAKIWASLDYDDSYYSNSFLTSSRITILPGNEALNIIFSPSYRIGRFPAWGGLDERLDAWKVDAELRSRVHPSYLLRLLGSLDDETRTRGELPLRSKNSSSAALSPILDFWLRLEPEIGFGSLRAEEPYYYSGLGPIEIRKLWIAANAEKKFKDWRTGIGFVLTQRQSNIAQEALPYSIEKDDPVGFTPSWNASVERSIIKGLSVRLAYRGTYYPDERGLENELNLSAGMYF